MSEIEIERVELPAKLDDLRALMSEIWGPEIVPPRNLLRGLALAGTCLLIARRDGRPIGFSLGWVGWSDGPHFHSHQTGVVHDERSEGVGFALKMAQRDDCLAHGITEMRWTFDPLLLSNAAFNLHRLGASVVGYYANCYGERNDIFNAGDVTDRLKVSWRLDQRVGREPTTTSFSDPRLISQNPIPERSPNDPASGALIPIPKRYHELRALEPTLADAWRIAMGAALADTYAAGLGVVGFGDGVYVVGPATP